MKIQIIYCKRIEIYLQASQHIIGMNILILVSVFLVFICKFSKNFTNLKKILLLKIHKRTNILIIF